MSVPARTTEPTDVVEITTDISQLMLQVDRNSLELIVVERWREDGYELHQANNLSLHQLFDQLTQELALSFPNEWMLGRVSRDNRVHRWISPEGPISDAVAADYPGVQITDFSTTLLGPNADGNGNVWYVTMLLLIDPSS